VWGAETGRAPVTPLLGHDSHKVQSVAISSYENRIVSRSYDGSCNGKILYGNAHINAFAISPDGRRIVSESGLADGTIHVWDMETGEAVRAPLVGHTRWIGSLAITPDGNYIVSGSYDHLIRVWDVDSRKTLVAPLLGHTGSINSVAITPDGSNDETVRVWDAKTGAVLGTPFQGHTGHVNSVATTPDGRRAVSGSDDKTIRV
jgi:WD40 repeat protein